MERAACTACLRLLAFTPKDAGGPMTGRVTGKKAFITGGSALAASS